jgi:hypothetical protein
LAWAVAAGLIHQVIGAAEPCPRQHPDAVIPPGMASYQPGRRMDEVMTETYLANYPLDDVPSGG